MKAWYFPSWNGDFRLEADPDDEKKTTLTIIDPTDLELEVLGKLVPEFKAQGFRDSEDPLWDPEGDKQQVVALTGELMAVGQLLLPKLKPGKATLTAVKVADGDIVTVRESDKKAAGGLDKALAVLGVDVAKVAKTAKAATVARPTTCCPQCVEGPLTPATEVLFEFLDDEEKERWSEDHAVVAEGNLTGHRYLLMHRHSRRARKIGWMCYDLDDGNHLHFYDWSVPPEEEVLASKLILENHEDWLRNEASCFHSSLKFKNPFGNFNDGVAESGVLGAIGSVFRTFSGALS